MEVTDPYHQPFSSIPHTIWWAIVTMTSTGYGDMVPITALGKLFGTAAAVSGVILIALPISVISTTFSAEFKLFTDKVRPNPQS
jgi:voltage-gated potassium channel Kch